VVHFAISIVMGSTTTFGSGSYSFSLPLASAGGTVVAVASARFEDSSATTAYAGAGNIGNSVSTMTFFVTNGATSGTVSNTNPFTWANGDNIRISGTYEIP